MRPCRQCRAPVENRVADCPQCGAAQEGAPKVNSDPPQPVQRTAHRLVFDLIQMTELAPVFVPVILVLPVALGWAVGTVIAGEVGAAVGVIAGVVFSIAVALWPESGG